MPPRGKVIKPKAHPAGESRRSVKVPVRHTASAASYTCQSCGRVSRESTHLCAPVETKELYVCSFCGASSGNPRHVCSPMLAEMKFYCETCGRVTPFRSAVCRPREIE